MLTYLTYVGCCSSPATRTTVAAQKTLSSIAFLMLSSSRPVSRLRTSVWAAPRFKPKMAPQPRISCDLLSISIGGTNFGDQNSACTAHCLVLGYSGGHCNSHDDNVCACH
uniref:Invertebrate defensins family profile domain-containing protein n=1 Tax=Branchiostoma floridae TaxID=7739 RepID=C3Z4F2_BRAFL|eukprot:XP_002596529.1 hypothetical protein BRAFLDRAFT_96429 [Branchiostoma floridae]